MDSKQKTLEIAGGRGKISYRLPNAIQVMRFQAAAGWYDKENMTDGSLRLAAGMEALQKGAFAHEFIIESDHYKTIQDVIDDGPAFDTLNTIVLDLAGRRPSELEKKP